MTKLNPTEIFRDWDFVDDRGDYATHTACAMSAAVALVRLRAGEPLGEATDHLDCVDEVIRQLVITRNDKTPDHERKAWALGVIPRIIDTAQGAAVSRKRAELVVRYACTFIVPETLDAAGVHDHAERLRSMDSATLEQLRDAANAAHAAAHAAFAAAEGSAARIVAYDAAWTADKAAGVCGFASAAAASDAAYAASDAAYAAAYAAGAAAHAGAIHADNPLRHLDAMLELCLEAKQ